MLNQTYKLKLGYSIGPQAGYFGSKGALDLIPQAEKAGFDSLWIADHFLPFFHTGAHSPQAFVLMTSALEKSKKQPIGTEVTVPMYRYHPLTIAHIVATMANIFPGRVIFGVGTGEAINEYPFISRWPKWKERSETLMEALTLIKKYWSSEEYFNFEGKYFNVRGAMCYDKPTEPIPIYVSAGGPKMAFLTGQNGYNIIADAMPDRAREILYPAFDKAALSGGHDLNKIEKAIVIGIGFGNPKELANKYKPLAACLTMLKKVLGQPDPKIIEAMGKNVTQKQILENMFFKSSQKDFINLINKCKRAGAQHIILEDWSIDAIENIEMFRKEIIPHFS